MSIRKYPGDERRWNTWQIWSSILRRLRI